MANGRARDHRRGAGDADAHDAALAQVVAILDRHGTLTRTVTRRMRMRRRPRLEALPPTAMRDALGDIAEFYVSRGPTSVLRHRCSGAAATQ